MPSEQTLYWVTPYRDTLQMSGSAEVIGWHQRQFQSLGWPCWTQPLAAQDRLCKVTDFGLCDREAFVEHKCPQCQSRLAQRDAKR